jgi:glycosyltransferase involved in cell wall biosynthesis
VRIFLKEACSLQTVGFNVTLLVADGLGNSEIYGVKVVDAGKFYGGRIKRFYQNPKRILKSLKDIDCEIYHFHDPELIPVGLRLIRKGKKVIYDAHEDLPQQTMSKEYIPVFFRKIVAIGIRMYENYASRKFSAILTATPFIRQRFEKLNANRIDINNYPLYDEINKSLQEKKRDGGVIYIGQISEARGIFPLLEALSNGNYKLKLAGIFENDKLKINVMQHLNWHKVEYLGQISRKELYEELMTSSVGVATFLPEPNHIHSQPNKMFEYMSAGIPVVASNFPLWKEIIEGNRCGICVDPMNPKAIADAINYLLINLDKAEEMGKNGQKAVINKYNWESEKKKLLGLYEKLINNV